MSFRASATVGAGLLLVSLLGAGCGSMPQDDEAAIASSIEEAAALLEIHPLDIWGQELPAHEATLTVTLNGRSIPVAAAGTTELLLKTRGSYEIELTAPYHETLAMAVRYDGSASEEGLEMVAAPSGHGVALGHERREAMGRALTTHVLYLGLRHKYFSAAGRPARRGNAVDLLMDGEEAWTYFDYDARHAARTIHYSTWWWESDFELVRDDRPKTKDERFRRTILGVFEKSPATKRVLVGQFWGQDSIVSWLSSDAKLRAFASAPNDRFEMMGQANETRGRFEFQIPPFRFGERVRVMQADVPALPIDPPIASTVPRRTVDLTENPIGADTQIASYHQKFAVIDDGVAYVGGMNNRETDWDSSKHAVYDARRMSFGASDSARSDVRAKRRLPDLGPRKDYMVRLEGPSATDVADVFRKRWQHQRSNNVTYAESATDIAAPRTVAPLVAGIQTQITTTLPQPFWEHSIAETWFNAVRNAESFIYIENQYFRVPMLNEAIAARMREKPELLLIVVTKPVGLHGLDCFQTYSSHAFFRAEFPDRYLPLQLRAFDADTRAFADMDVHSKMLIVDDVFMSVGSANANNRGIVYEGEMSVAIVDPSVAKLRERIATDLLGEPAGDPKAFWTKLRAAARANDTAASSGRGSPKGFVYPLVQGDPSSCTFKSVGPDTT